MTIWDRMFKNWWGVKIGHQAMMLDDAQKLLQQNRRQNQTHREAMMGEPSQPETEDDGVHVGDKVQHFYSDKRDQRKSGLLPLLLTAGLAAGGGAGLALLDLARERSHSATSESHVEDVDLIVKWKLDDKGAWQTEVERAKPETTK